MGPEMLLSAGVNFTAAYIAKFRHKKGQNDVNAICHFILDSPKISKNIYRDAQIEICYST
jgi:hypothetical protein